MIDNDKVSLGNKYASDGNNDLVDRLFYPLLFRITKHIPSSIKPNYLTVAAFIFGVLSAISLICITSKYALIVSSLCIFFWWFFDGLDGIHARNTNQCSTFGAFLDHFFDTLFAGIFLFAVLYYFNLFSPLFVFLVILRLMTQAVFFLSQVFIRVLFLPKLGPSCETFAVIVIFILVFFYDESIIKVALMSYFLLLPYAIYSIYIRTLHTIIHRELIFQDHHDSK